MNYKWAVLGSAAAFGFAHIGILGHLMSRSQLPVINLPVGDYTSYIVEAHKDGYRIQYNSNDPNVLGVRKFVDKKNGVFGIGGESTTTFKEEYTMDGARHRGGGDVVKLSAEKLACIKAEGGGENAGRQVGATIGAATAPAVLSIPYIGWLAAGWAALLGNNIGSSAGSLVNSAISDC